MDNDREQAFDALFDTVPDALLVTDDSGRCVDANAAACRLFGLSRESLLGRRILDFAPPGISTQVKNAWREFLRTGRQEGLFTLCGPDGAPRELECRVRANFLPGRHLAILCDVTERKRAEERGARQQALTAAFSGSLTPAQVVDVVVGQVVEALGARAGLVALLTPDGTELEVVRDTGYAPETIARWQRFPLPASLPLSDVVRENRPLFLENKHVFAERYPDLRGDIGRADEAAAALPLVVHGRAIGGMYLTFPRTRVFSEEERAFLGTLAHQCAQALERARLYEEALVARRRMAFLAEVSAALAASLDYETMLASLARLLVPELADWSAVDMADEDGAIRRLAVAHMDPKKVEWAHEVNRRYPLDPRAPGGVPRVLRTGAPELYPRITDEMLAGIARSEEHLALLRQLCLTSILIVPLAARGRILGAITFVATAESDRHYGADDLAFAQEVARRAAVVVDNARLYRLAQEEIAERQRAQEDRYRLAAIVASSTDAIIGKTLDGVITSWNAGAERLYGYRAEEVVGQNIALLIPPHRADDLPVILDRIRRGERVEPYETVRRRRDGSLLDVSLTVSPIKDDAGRVIGASAIARDITERKQIEAERLRLLAQVREAAVQQRAFLRDVLASVTEGRLHLCHTAADLPRRLPPIETDIALTRPTLRALHRRTEEAAEALGFDETRSHDLLAAVIEASMNAVVHAEGAMAHIGTDGSDAIQVWIEDRGKGIDMGQLPRFTLGRGHSGHASPGFGHGFWLILKSIDRCFLLTGPSGTTIVLEQARTIPEPAWLTGL